MHACAENMFNNNEYNLNDNKMLSGTESTAYYVCCSYSL